jgi:hypothetical protein
LLELVVQSQTSSESEMVNVGKFCGSQRPSAKTQMVMPVVAPVPTATIRRGREGLAPFEVTRTGCMV